MCTAIPENYQKEFSDESKVRNWKSFDSLSNLVRDGLQDKRVSRLFKAEPQLGGPRFTSLSVCAQLSRDDFSFAASSSTALFSGKSTVNIA